MINQRWLKSYQIDFVTEDTHHDEPGCTSKCAPEYDLLPEPPMQKTLSQAQKYNMLNLCQKIAAQASMVGMPQFREMYNTVETLVKNWHSGSKCVVVSCDDETHTEDHEESTLDEQVDVIASDEAGKECTWESAEFEVEYEVDNGTTRHGDVTQNSDSTRYIDTTGHSDVTQMTRHGDVTQNSITTRYIDTSTSHSDVTQNSDTTRHVDTAGHSHTTKYVDVDTTRYANTVLLKEEIMQPAKRATMQQNTSLQSSTSINKSSIHLKPTIKARGRPKYSSKLRPSKSKRRQHSEDTSKENIQPTVQVDSTSKQCGVN